MRPGSTCATLTLMLTLGACQPRPAASVEPGVSAARADEDSSDPTSVRPGINDRYFEAGAVEQWTDILERERREVIAHRDAIVDELALTPGLRVADIGAGTGAFIAALSAGVGADGQVYAVDIVPSFLDHLRARAASEGLANVAVIEATPTDATLAEHSVDLLFMSDVYHHIEYPSIYLQTLHRALAPGGRFVIVEFDRVPGKTSARMLAHVREDKPTLIAELTQAGFVLDHEIESIPFEENYMLVFRKA